MRPMIRVFLSCVTAGFLIGACPFHTTTTQIRPIVIDVEAETKEEEDWIVVERHIEKSTEMEETCSEIPVVETEIIETNIQTEELTIFTDEFPEENIQTPEPEWTTEPKTYLTDAEIDLIAQITMAEVGNQPEYTQRLVIDTMLNRLDSSHFPDSIYDIIYAPGQWEVVSNGFLYQCYAREDLRALVLDELNNRTSYEVIYFNSDYFPSYGIPIIQLGPVFFSGCQY